MPKKINDRIAEKIERALRIYQLLLVRGLADKDARPLAIEMAMANTYHFDSVDVGRLAEILTYFVFPSTINPDGCLLTTDERHVLEANLDGRRHHPDKSSRESVVRAFKLLRGICENTPASRLQTLIEEEF
jgi:hypothetical protein